MSNQILVRNFRAEAAIAAFTIVRVGSADGQVLAGAGATDRTIGISTDIAVVTGERCDVILAGAADVTYGGAVTRGDLVTSDATGRAVTAAPAVGVNNRIIGVALLSGVAGDLGQVQISQGSIQG